MKAHIIQTYVFIEERDFSQGTIVNDDILFRIEELATSTLRVSKVYLSLIHI